jgi:hypothetical protein
MLQAEGPHGRRGDIESRASCYRVRAQVYFSLPLYYVLRTVRPFFIALLLQLPVPYDIELRHNRDINVYIHKD